MRGPLALALVGVRHATRTRLRAARAAQLGLSAADASAGGRMAATRLTRHGVAHQGVPAQISHEMHVCAEHRKSEVLAELLRTAGGPARPPKPPASSKE